MLMQYTTFIETTQYKRCSLPSTSTSLNHYLFTRFSETYKLFHKYKNIASKMLFSHNENIIIYHQIEQLHYSLSSLDGDDDLSIVYPVLALRGHKILQSIGISGSHFQVSSFYAKICSGDVE
jgi:hypothetical protein